MTQKSLLAAVKGKAALLFITHALPKSLRIDEAVHLSRDGARQLQAMPGQAVARQTEEKG